MGQFSWFTIDTYIQIGSQPENKITVSMVDDKGNIWTENNYEGYGIFNNKDYFVLMAEMNGIEGDDKFKRVYAINLYYDYDNELGTKPPLFPALIEHIENFDYTKHDFKVAPDNDPNQGWFVEVEYVDILDDESDIYDYSYYEDEED